MKQEGWAVLDPEGEMGEGIPHWELLNFARKNQELREETKVWRYLSNKILKVGGSESGWLRWEHKSRMGEGQRGKGGGEKGPGGEGPEKEAGQSENIQSHRFEMGGCTNQIKIKSILQTHPFWPLRSGATWVPSIHPLKLGLSF